MITEVAGQYNAEDLENQIRLLWEKEQTYRTVRKLRVGGKKFFFVDGPPYTTGRIHRHRLEQGDQRLSTALQVHELL